MLHHWIRTGLAFAMVAVSGFDSAAHRALQLVDVEVGPPPAVVRTGKMNRLAYELHVTSFAKHPLRLERLRILAGDERSPISELRAAELKSACIIVGGGRDPLILEPGRRAVIYLDLDAPGKLAGVTLAHELSLTEISDDGVSATVTGGITTVLNASVPVLGPPLRDGPWVAVYDPGLERGHRRVFYATEGEATLPGRFAIDFMKVDDAGRLSAGDGEKPSEYYGYEEPVLAVADGKVVAVRDDVPDPLNRSGRARPSIGDASGNYIALQIGAGRYVFYEHLKRGIGVKVGETVRKGQVIGALGFTGQAGVPHLHFHLADRLSVLGAEGQPFTFSRYERLGRYNSINEIGREGAWTAGRETAIVKNAMPAANVVIRFEGE